MTWRKVAVCWRKNILSYQRLSPAVPCQPGPAVLVARNRTMWPTKTPSQLPAQSWGLYCSFDSDACLWCLLDSWFMEPQPGLLLLQLCPCLTPTLLLHVPPAITAIWFHRLVSSRCIWVLSCLLRWPSSKFVQSELIPLYWEFNLCQTDPQTAIPPWDAVVRTRHATLFCCVSEEWSAHGTTTTAAAARVLGLLSESPPLLPLFAATPLQQSTSVLIASSSGDPPLQALATAALVGCHFNYHSLLPCYPLGQTLLILQQQLLCPFAAIPKPIQLEWSWIPSICLQGMKSAFAACFGSFACRMSMPLITVISKVLLLANLFRNNVRHVKRQGLWDSCGKYNCIVIV